MPVFEYEIADPRGVLSRGRAEAESQGALILRFREQGRLVVGVRTVERAGRAEGLSALADGLKASFGEVGRRVGLETLLLFTGQLAAMLAGGLHLARILSALAGETTNKRLRRVLDDVRKTITAGSSFADALGLHPHVFDRLYVAVVRAGELSGSLPVVLDALTIYLEKSAQLRRKVVGAITYPAVILAVTAAMVFAMTAFLVPVFEGVYARANTALPAPTRVLIAVSGVLRGYALAVVAGAAAAAVLLYAGAQTPRGRRLIDAAKLRVPLFGPLVRKAVLARTCRTLSVLLSSGIPLIEAMGTVARVSGNRVIEDALTEATGHVQDGGTIAETLKRTGEFPSMVVQFVATGEESGTLPAMLARAATYYEQQVDNTVATLSTLIEPLMIVVMGVLAGGVIFALYLPIFSLGQAIKGSAR
jgi:type IV pilus assembly protein PilC